MLIYGSGIYARLLRNLLEQLAIDCFGYIDDFHQGESIVGNYDDAKHTFPPTRCGIVIGVGYKHFDERWRIFQQVKADGYLVPSLIHPAAYVANRNVVGAGSVVMAGAVLDTRATLGELCVVWPGACVNHDTRVGRNTFISPNATVCGNVSVGEFVFIGAGAIIADHLQIADNVFIPAGDVVGKHSPQRPRRAL